MAEELHGSALERERPASLIVLLTSRCNMECSYCYRGAEVERDLEWEKLRSALNWFAGAAGPGPEVVFTGGEPLLALDTMRRAMDHLEACLTHVGAATFRVLTNGLLLDDAVLDFLERRDVGIQLSHDGLPGAQDQRRPGSWQVLDGILARIRSDHPRLLERRLTIAVTVHPENADLLAGSCSYLMSRGVRDIQLSPTLQPTPDWDQSGLARLETQFASLHDACREFQRRTGEIPLRLFRRWSVNSGGDGGESGTRDRWECAAPRGSAPAVGLDGQLYACPLFAPGGGRRRSGDGGKLVEAMRWGEPGTDECERRRLESMRRLGAFSAMRPETRRGSRTADCEGCPSRSSCRTCPWTSLWRPEGESGTVPAFLCDFNRTALAWRRRYPPRSAEEQAVRHPSEIEAARQAWLRDLGWHRLERD
jgi:sulfatase maturation enzyme AslB (radical SAM superfamily)